MALLTESGLALETESGIELNRESYVPPPKRYGRKKILFFPEIKHFEKIVKMRGDTRLPQQDQVITITSKIAQQTSGSLQYKGTVRLVKDNVQVVGSGIKKLQESKIKIKGDKSRTVNESLIIEGKKDYSVLLNKLEELELV